MEAQSAFTRQNFPAADLRTKMAHARTTESRPYLPHMRCVVWPSGLKGKLYPYSLLRIYLSQSLDRHAYLSTAFISLSEKKRETKSRRLHPLSMNPSIYVKE